MARTSAAPFVHRMLVVGVLGLAGSTLVACGGGGEPLTATLAATGTGERAEVTYSIDGEETTEEVALPWELPVEVDGDIDLALTVTNLDEDGIVGCAIGFGISTPEVEGEVSATCELSGSANDGKVSVFANEDFVDREPGGEEASGTTSASVVTGPVTVTAEIHDLDGLPVETPAVGGRYVAALVVDGIDREVVVQVTSELTDGATNWTDKESSRHEIADTEDGRLVLGVRQFEIEEQTTFRWTLSGAVYASDDSYEAPYELELEFVPAPLDEKSAEEAAIEHEFLSGAVTSVLPTGWDVIDEAGDFSIVHEATTMTPIDFDGDDLEGVLDLGSGTSDSEVHVFRSTRPLGLAAPDTMIEQVTDELGTLGFQDLTPGPLQLGDHAGVRFEATGPDGSYLVDLVSVGREFFVVQTTMEAGDPDADDARTVADSLRFHPEHFPQLTHAVECHSSFTKDGVTTRISIDAPATWAAPSDSRNGVTCEAEPGGDRVEAYTFPLDGRAVEAVLSDKLAEFGYRPVDVEIEQTTFGDHPGRIVTVPDSATVFAAIEWPSELGYVGVVVIATGDQQLNLAMARSLVGEVDA